MNYKHLFFLTILFGANNIICGDNITIYNGTGKEIYVFGQKHINAISSIFLHGFNDVGIKRVIAGKSIEIEPVDQDLDSSKTKIFVRFKDDDMSDPLYLGDRGLVKIVMGGGPGKNRFKIDSE